MAKISDNPHHSMGLRLRVLLIATALAYSLWMAAMLSITQGWAGTTIAGNLAMGLLLGVQATFLTDNHAPRLFLRDGLSMVAFFAMVAGIFAAFTLRGNFIYATVDFFGTVQVDRAGIVVYLWRFIWRGAVLGGLMWVLALASAGLNQETNRGYIMAAVVVVGTVLAAPFIANALFNGALFVVLGVGVRLALGLGMVYINWWWQGFIFGVCAGLLIIFLPLLGYYGYGVI